MRKSAFLAAVLLAPLLLASCNIASGRPAISVDNAWARATVPGQMSSAAYFTIRNTGGADALVSVTSPDANATLHSTTMDNGIMRMRPLPKLEVPANSSVTLKPGGMHVMLMGLHKALQVGSTIDLGLKFEKSGEKHVTVPVRPAGATGAGM